MKGLSDNTQPVQQIFDVLTNAEQKKIDYASSTVTYIGYADFGVATSAPRWIIQRITFTSGTDPQGVGSIEYATGSPAAFLQRNQIWDNRVSLVYTS